MPPTATTARVRALRLAATRQTEAVASAATIQNALDQLETAARLLDFAGAPRRVVVGEARGERLAVPRGALARRRPVVAHARRALVQLSHQREASPTRCL